MSQQPSVWRNVIVLSCVFTGLAFALSANGQDKKAGTGFAIVDVGKLSEGYKARADFESQLRAMQAKLQARLDRRDNMPFLTEEEQLKLDELNEKATRTEAENKQMKDLETKNRTVSEEILALRQKPDNMLNDADKAKLAAADKNFREAQGRFTAMRDNLSTQINQFGKSQSEDLMKKVKVSVSKVAEQKGIALVFNSEVALYAGTDITDAVLSELNKK
jgi:Skp family chaperone for outer membrane proteins